MTKRSVDDCLDHLGGGIGFTNALQSLVRPDPHDYHVLATGRL